MGVLYEADERNVAGMKSVRREEKMKREIVHLLHRNQIQEAC